MKKENKQGEGKGNCCGEVNQELLVFNTLNGNGFVLSANSRNRAFTGKGELNMKDFSLQ